MESTLVDNATKLQFTYDYIGRRIQKQVYAWDAASDLWSLTSDLRYVYDGWNLIEVLDATDSNSVAKSYTWGLDLSQSLQGAGGVGGLLAVTEHGETADTPYYATYDANGNISEYLDNTGSVAVHYEYSPFGRLTLVDSETGAPDFNHRFSTKFFDTETRLYYYGFRYYSSELGRWLSRDPIQENGGLNLYVFVRNCPILEVDIDGRLKAGDIAVVTVVVEAWEEIGYKFAPRLAQHSLALGRDRSAKDDEIEALRSARPFTRRYDSGFFKKFACRRGSGTHSWVDPETISYGSDRQAVLSDIGAAYGNVRYHLVAEITGSSPSYHVKITFSFTDTYDFRSGDSLNPVHAFNRLQTAELASIYDSSGEFVIEKDVCCSESEPWWRFIWPL